MTSPAMRALNTVCGAVAGPCTTAPSPTRNTLPCHGQLIGPISAVLGYAPVVQGSLADPPVLVTGGVQFRIGGVLKGEQGVVRVRQGVQDLVELALRCPLVPRLGVLDDEDHRERERGDQGLEDGLPPCRKPGGDAYHEPCRDYAEDHQGNRWAGRMPVYPGQPPADRRPGPFLRRV
jgi:hypothetical protein